MKDYPHGASLDNLTDKQSLCDCAACMAGCLITATHICTLTTPHKLIASVCLLRAFIETGQLMAAEPCLDSIFSRSSRLRAADLPVRFVRTPECSLQPKRASCWLQKRRATERDRDRASKRARDTHCERHRVENEVEGDNAQGSGIHSVPTAR